MHLIRAEAMNELGQTGAAVAWINNSGILSRVNAPAFAAADQASFRTAILRERLFEFAGEAKRRMDLIRHGQFTRAWFNKPVSAAHRILLPIPQTQIDANPLLEQNPGY